MTDTTQFTRDERVKTHPATAAFQRGEVYGTVVSVTFRREDNQPVFHVRMDISDKIRKFAPENLLPVEIGK